MTAVVLWWAHRDGGYRCSDDRQLYNLLDERADNSSDLHHVLAPYFVELPSTYPGGTEYERAWVAKGLLSMARSLVVSRLELTRKGPFMLTAAELGVIASILKFCAESFENMQAAKTVLDQSTPGLAWSALVVLVHGGG